MANLLGPDSNSRHIERRTDLHQTEAYPGHRFTLYTDEELTELAVIREYSPGSPSPGDVIPDSTVTLDAGSDMPLFWFPDDDVDTLWTSGPGGWVFKLNADYDARLDAASYNAEQISVRAGLSGAETLVAGTVTVSMGSVTALSRILLTVQELGTVVVPQAVAVTARTPEVSFTITSADATDTSLVAWHMITPE